MTAVIICLTTAFWNVKIHLSRTCIQNGIMKKILYNESLENVFSDFLIEVRM